MGTLQQRNGQLLKMGIWTGDVIIFQGQRYKVTKAKQVNWEIMDESGKKFNLRMTANVVRDEDQSWNGPKEKTPYELAVEAQSSGIVIGSVVNFTSVAQARKYPGDYVVCSAVNSSGKVRLAKLGGEGGRYFSGYPVSALKLAE